MRQCRCKSPVPPVALTVTIESPPLHKKIALCDESARTASGCVIVAHYSAATIGIGYREAEWTSRYPALRSVTGIRRCATRSGDVYRCRATITQDRVMSLAGAQLRGLADVAAHYSAATIGIGYREAEWTSRYPALRSVTGIRRCATRSGDVYRCRATITQDRVMSLAGVQLRGLADVAAHYSAATIGIGYREAEWTSRYPALRSVTGIRRCATRSGDVYRCRATITQDRVMSLAGAQLRGLADVAAHYSAATIGIGYREAEWTSRYPALRSVTGIRRCATRSGDVYRCRATITQDRVMSLAGAQLRGLADVARRRRRCTRWRLSPCTSKVPAAWLNVPVPV